MKISTFSFRNSVSSNSHPLLYIAFAKVVISQSPRGAATREFLKFEARTSTNTLWGPVADDTSLSSVYSRDFTDFSHSAGFCAN